MDEIFSDAFRQTLEAHCTPQQVRGIEAGDDPAGLWRAIEESGFASALLPEGADGAGLRLRDVFPLLRLDGAHSVPVPFALTVLLRPVLHAAGCEVPAGRSLTLACDAHRDERGRVHCAAVPYGVVADRVVAVLEDGPVLVDTARTSRTPTGVHGSLEADISWDRDTRTVALDARADWLAIGAVACAAQMAGAMERILQLSVEHANARVQFGKPIGKFQAIQQQFSVMAEEVYAAHMAAEMGCASATPAPDALLAAVAKSRSSEAAPTVAAIAHAVHGAIGITAEYDLQLFTRRLHEWRLAYGAESYWNARIGKQVIASRGTSLEFVRNDIFLWEDGPAAEAARVA